MSSKHCESTDLAKACKRLSKLSNLSIPVQLSALNSGKRENSEKRVLNSGHRGISNRSKISKISDITRNDHFKKITSS